MNDATFHDRVIYKFSCLLNEFVALVNQVAWSVVHHIVAIVQHSEAAMVSNRLSLKE